MTSVSLVGAASYMPRQVVENDFFSNGPDEHVPAFD